MEDSPFKMTFFLAVIYILLLFQFTFYSSSTIKDSPTLFPRKYDARVCPNLVELFFIVKQKKKIFVGHLEPCFHFMTWFLMPNFVSYFQQIRLYTCVVISPPKLWLNDTSRVCLGYACRSMLTKHLIQFKAFKHLEANWQQLCPSIFFNHRFLFFWSKHEVKLFVILFQATKWVATWNRQINWLHFECWCGCCRVKWNKSNQI